MPFKRQTNEARRQNRARSKSTCCEGDRAARSDMTTTASRPRMQMPCENERILQNRPHSRVFAGFFDRAVSRWAFLAGDAGIACLSFRRARRAHWRPLPIPRSVSRNWDRRPRASGDAKSAPVDSAFRRKTQGEVTNFPLCAGSTISRRAHLIKSISW